MYREMDEYEFIQELFRYETTKEIVKPHVEQAEKILENMLKG